jgi:hypothetical protein
MATPPAKDSSRVNEDRRAQTDPGHQSPHSLPLPSKRPCTTSQHRIYKLANWDVFQSTAARAPSSARLTLQNGTSILTRIIDGSSAGDGPHHSSPRPGQLLSVAVPGFPARRPGMAASRSPGAACPAATTAIAIQEAIGPNHLGQISGPSSTRGRARSQPLLLDDPHHMPLAKFLPTVCQANLSGTSPPSQSTARDILA